MLASIAMAAVCGLSPDPEPVGPKAEALTGRSARGEGEGLADGLAPPEA